MLWGEKFSPIEAHRITGVKFDVCNEPEDIATTGPYKNERPFGYGSALIRFVNEFVDTDPDDILSPDARILDLLECHISNFRKAGAEIITLHVIYFSDTSQCNISQGPKLLARLAGLGISFTISCELIQR